MDTQQKKHQNPPFRDFVDRRTRDSVVLNSTDRRFGSKSLLPCAVRLHAVDIGSYLEKEVAMTPTRAMTATITSTKPKPGALSSNSAVGHRVPPPPGHSHQTR
jgi:hypothetical protein